MKVNEPANKRRRNLIIVRAGDRSLHPSWLPKDQNRNWDIHVSYFGHRKSPYSDQIDFLTLTHDPGTKYIGLKSLLEKKPEWRSQYDYICLADDDIDATAGEWNLFFDVICAVKPTLAQPALNHLSFFSHSITLRRKAYLYREVNFIETMMPTFRSERLFDFFEYFDDNQSSLGLDYVWSQKCSDLGELMIIVDAVGFVHTRAVGAGAQYAAFSNQAALSIDLNKILVKHGVSAVNPKAFRGVTPKSKVDTNQWKLNTAPLPARLFRKLKTIMNLKEVVPFRSHGG